MLKTLLNLTFVIGYEFMIVDVRDKFSVKGRQLNENLVVVISNRVVYL